MKRLFCFFKGYGKASIIAPVFKMLEAIFELFVPLCVANIIDKGIKNGDNKFIFSNFAIMFALAIIGLVCAISAQYFAAKAAVGVSASLRSSLFEKIQSFSYSQTDKVGTSTLITRLTADINSVQTGINLFLRLFMRSPFIVFGAMIMAFTINARLAIIFVITIIVLSVIVFGIMLINIPMYKKVQSSVDTVVEKTRSNYIGTRVVRAFNRQDDEINDFERRHTYLTKLQLTAGRISALMNPLTYVVVNAAIIILIKNGAKFVDGGVISQGQLVALYNYMTQILVELIKLASLIITLNKSAASLHRINNIFDMDVDLAVCNGDDTHQGAAQIIVDNVSFSYSTKGDEAISGVSFSVNKGEKIGIIGGTGSGKTTLINLLPGFYHPTKGNVYIDGKNTALWDAEDLKQKYGIVPQKAVLFNGTIRSNLMIGNSNADEAEIWDALSIAQASEFVNSKEDKLEESVSQSGANFSGGQKQRLTIARALIRHPDILVLDDSSSALDYATESKLRDAINSLSWNPTVIIVSQRASSVIECDKIIVLDDGACVGMGTHSELLDTCQTYREIYNSQFGGEQR